LTERFIEEAKAKERERKFESVEREAEWSGFLFGVAPNLLPSLFTALQPGSARFPQRIVRETRFANIVFIATIRIYRFHYPLLCSNGLKERELLLQAETNFETLHLINDTG